MTTKLFFLIITLFCLAAAARAQAILRFDHGQFARNGGDISGSVNGTFRLQNSTSDITGRLSGIPSSGVFTLCDFYGTPCAPGQTIRILDQITGSSGLRQDGAPIVVNGVTYKTVVYFGQLTFTGGTVRIPYYMAKRKTFKVTVRGRLTGSLLGYPTPTSTEAIFGASLDLTGTVTLVFNRKEDGSSNPTYALGGVTYDFPTPGN